MSFADTLAQINRAELSKAAQQSKRTHVARVIDRSQHTIADLPQLLSPAADDFLNTMLEKSNAISLQRFGKTINLFSPLYLSNYCGNKCTYCGYSAERKIVRRRLSQEEIMTEAKVLSDRGFRNLLLVTGEDPTYITPAFLAETGRNLKSLFPALSIEIQPFDTAEEYKTVVDGGIDGLSVYQETYDREIYDQIHIRGKKKRFDNRLLAIERGAEGGMRRLGIGVLLGLAEWIPDVISLAVHAQYLQKHHWKSLISFSFPRIRPMGADINIEHAVSERDFVKLICAFRMVFPDNPLVLSTRERPELRDALIPCGITHMSAGSSTEPGGYTEAELSGTQFQLSDERSAQSVASHIEKSGYEPVWKDWQ